MDDRILELARTAAGPYLAQREDQSAPEDESACTRHLRAMEMLDFIESELSSLEEEVRERGTAGRSGRAEVLYELVERCTTRLAELGVYVDMDLFQMDMRKAAMLLHQLAWHIESIADFHSARTAAKPRVRVPARTSSGNVIPFIRR